MIKLLFILLVYFMLMEFLYLLATVGLGTSDYKKWVTAPDPQGYLEIVTVASIIITALMAIIFIIVGLVNL